MSRMVAVGTDRLTQALAAAGFVPEVCAAPAQVSAALARLARDTQVALVACGESQADQATDAIQRFRDESAAMLVILPDTLGAKGRVGFELVRQALEQAAGVDLLGRVAEGSQVMTSDK